MKIKLSRLKQIIQEVVEERYASERMDDIMQSTKEEEVVEEVVEETNPYEQALDEMIAEEIEAALQEFIVEEAPPVVSYDCSEPPVDSDHIVD